MKRRKSRKKPVEAWALVSRHGNGIDSFYRTEPEPFPLGTPCEEQDDLRVAHLVEREPGAAAELKSLRRLAKAVATLQRPTGAAKLLSYTSRLGLMFDAMDRHRRLKG